MSIIKIFEEFVERTNLVLKIYDQSLNFSLKHFPRDEMMKAIEDEDRKPGCIKL